MIKTFITILLAFCAGVSKGQRINKDAYFGAKAKIENMLNGKEKLNYETAIFVIENAWYDGRVRNKDWNTSMAYHIQNIQRIYNAHYNEAAITQTPNLLIGKEQLISRYKRALTNWAIYTYITQPTVFKYGSEILYHRKYSYSFTDPMASNNWENTQIIKLLNSQQGNCFALASLFKIFADRLESEAQLCTAPSHIYIAHEDEKGTLYNVELGSESFPGTGTISAVTYTTDKAIENNIAQRKLSPTQQVALSLVYLAKGFQHKFHNDRDSFIIQCAISALNYDPKNLNALLLKAEYLENGIIGQNKSLDELQNQNDFQDYQKLISQLYDLGYREMTLEMKNTIVRLYNKDKLEAKGPAYTTDKKGNVISEATLSWGLFDERHAIKANERYGNTIFDTKKKKIVGFASNQNLYNNYNFDPVLFAMNVDPLASKFPSHSPYSAMGGNPISNVDPTGAAFIVADKAQQATTLGYINDQLGTGLFSFRGGQLKVNQSAYDAAAKNFNPQQRAMGEGMLKIVSSPRVIEAKLYSNENVNFTRNPQVQVTTMQKDPDMNNMEVPVTTSHPMFSGKGLIVESVKEAATFNIPGDDRAFILMNTSGSNTYTFNANGGGKTNACASCIFMHELLDHGLGYINTGNVPNNEDAGVTNHNNALENKGSPKRDGSDHSNIKSPYAP